VNVKFGEGAQALLRVAAQGGLPHLGVAHVLDAVKPHLVAFGAHALNQLGRLAGTIGYDEKGRRCAFAAQTVEHPRGPHRIRPVIEGQAAGTDRRTVPVGYEALALKVVFKALTWRAAGELARPRV